MMHSQKKH